MAVAAEVDLLRDISWLAFGIPKNRKEDYCLVQIFFTSMTCNYLHFKA